jgi:hypothetical protein
MPIKDPEKRRQYDKVWCDSRRDEINAARRARYAALKQDDPEAYEARRARERAQANANIEYNRERQKRDHEKYREKRLATKRAYKKARLASDPEYKLNLYLRKRLNSALKKNSKRGSGVRLLGCSISEFKLKIESLWSEGMSWENYGKWHIDHRKPLIAFDLLDPLQLAAACHHTNLQPLWKTDNLRKGAKWVEPSLGDPATTRGEIGALAGSQEPTKLRSLNREHEPMRFTTQ